MEFLTTHKTKRLKYKDVFYFKLSDVVFIMLINVKMPTIGFFFFQINEHVSMKKKYNLGA